MRWPWEKKQRLPEQLTGFASAAKFRRWGRQTSPPLPISGLRVDYRIMRCYEAVLAGMLPLQFLDPEKQTPEELQAQAELHERNARATVCACAVKPRFTERIDPKDPDQVCVDDLKEPDLYFLYGLMLKSSHSRLAPADPSAAEREGISPGLVERQGKSLGAVGILCHFFPQLDFNHVLYKMEPDEFNIYWAAMEEAFELKKEADGNNP